MRALLIVNLSPEELFRCGPSLEHSNRGGVPSLSATEGFFFAQLAHAHLLRKELCGFDLHGAPKAPPSLIAPETCPPTPVKRKFPTLDRIAACKPEVAVNTWCPTMPRSKSRERSSIDCL
eukprot:5680175-Amphidinium_carterae.1